MGEVRRHGARQQVRRVARALIGIPLFAYGDSEGKVQPLAALIGIVMGSSVALLAGLSMTLLVFLLLPEFRDRLAGEFRPLLEAIAWAALLTGVSVAAFVGQLRRQAWRVAAQLGLLAAVLAVGWRYWP